MAKGRPRKNWLSYSAAKMWVQKIAPIYGITNYNKWKKFVSEFELPEGIPTHPYRTYGKEYISDFDFFGKPAKHRLTYAAAKKYMAQFKIPSQIEWYKWYSKNKPSFIPGSPRSFYGDDWVSWKDFLSNGKCEEYAPYDEAIKWVHKQSIKSNRKWRKACAEGVVPANIPHRPDVYYEEWISWPVWLGKSVSDRLQIMKKNTNVLFVVQEREVPSNVYTIGIEKDGVNAIKLWQEVEKFKILRIYEFTIGKGKILNDIISNTCTVWWESESDNQYLVPNVFSLLNDLDYNFTPIFKIK